MWAGKCTMDPGCGPKIVPSHRKRNTEKTLHNSCKKSGTFIARERGAVWLGCGTYISFALSMVVGRYSSSVYKIW